MKCRLYAIVGTVLVLIGGTAWLLAHIESLQRLGVPGVKVVAESMYDLEGKEVGTNSVYLPEKVLDFESRKLGVSQEVLDWLPKDTTYGQRDYRAPDGFQVVLNVVLMGSDRTSIHKPQYCLTGQGWKIEEDRTRMTSIPVAEPHPYDLPVKKMVLTRTLQMPNGTERVARGVFVYWFVADGQLTADHNERMWWMARDLIGQGLLQRWAYVSCFSICAPGEEDRVYERMARLLAAAVPQFQLVTGPSRQYAIRD